MEIVFCDTVVKGCESEVSVYSGRLVLSVAVFFLSSWLTYVTFRITKQDCNTLCP